MPLPDGIDHERAVLVEPLACCVGALAPHADAQFVAVLGCGPLGLLTVYLARRAGRTSRRRSAGRAARDRRAARRGRHRGRARSGRLRPRRRRGRLRADVARGDGGRSRRRDGRDARARQRGGDVPDGGARPPRRHAARPVRLHARRVRARARGAGRGRSCRSTGSRPRRWPRAPRRSRTSSTGRPSTPRSCLRPERAALPRHRRVRLHRRLGRRRARRRRAAGRDFDLSTEPRGSTLLDADAVAAVPHVAGDITDLATLERAIDEHGITHVIHLAALQVPFCRADPPLGARVNVLGTVNVFEAAKARAAARADHVRELDRGVRRGRDDGRPPGHDLRRLQAGERVDGRGLPRRERHREHRACARTRSTASAATRA